MPFNGLPRDYFAFFTELAANNNRDWFAANKTRFKDNVEAPLIAFVEAMAPRLKTISKHIVADPRPVGGSVFRIYKDVRFSKDKSPYKIHGGVQFRHASGKDAHAPGFYVHLAADEIFYGGGVWTPEPPVLLKIREAVRDKGPAWTKVKAAPAFVKRFGALRGESLTRPPRGFDAEHPHAEDIRRKSFFVMETGTRKRALSPLFLDDVEAAFIETKPFMKFLCESVGAPF